MAEEIKTEVKTSLAKGFFSNPLSWLVMTITVGTFLFNLGGSTTSKKNDISGISKDQTDIKADINRIHLKVLLLNMPRSPMLCKDHMFYGFRNTVKTLWN